MRRSDREITDPAVIDDIIARCDCCRLALADGTHPYIVPLNFGFRRCGGHPVFYFHSAPQGRKLDLIQRNGCAGFELDTNSRLNPHETACGHSFRFQSVIGTGAVSMVEEPAEKVLALQLIMQHYTGRGTWQFDSAGVDRVAVFRLDVQELSCKQHE